MKVFWIKAVFRLICGVMGLAVLLTILAFVETIAPIGIFSHHFAIRLLEIALFFFPIASFLIPSFYYFYFRCPNCKKHLPLFDSSKCQICSQEVNDRGEINVLWKRDTRLSEILKTDFFRIVQFLSVVGGLSLFGMLTYFHFFTVTKEKLVKEAQNCLFLSIHNKSDFEDHYNRVVKKVNQKEGWFDNSLMVFKNGDWALFQIIDHHSSGDLGAFWIGISSESRFIESNFSTCFSNLHEPVFSSFLQPDTFQDLFLKYPKMEFHFIQ